jgi:hypothetical protein
VCVDLMAHRVLNGASRFDCLSDCEEMELELDEQDHGVGLTICKVKSARTTVPVGSSLW